MYLLLCVEVPQSHIIWPCCLCSPHSDCCSLRSWWTINVCYCVHCCGGCGSGTAAGGSHCGHHCGSSPQGKDKSTNQVHRVDLFFSCVCVVCVRESTWKITKASWPQDNAFCSPASNYMYMYMQDRICDNWASEMIRAMASSLPYTKYCAKWCPTRRSEQSKLIPCCVYTNNLSCQFCSCVYMCM